MSVWSDQIEEDLDWRESELASLRRLVSSAQSNSVQQTALLRAICALLYAHYEGFCKFAWGIYIEALSQQGITREKLKQPLALLSMYDDIEKTRKEMGKLPDDEKDNYVWKFCTVDFPTLLSEKALFHNVVFDTSNLKPSLLKKYCEKVMFPYDAVEEHEQTLKTLISRRNEIAHGQKNVVSSFIEYKQLEDAAIHVMYDLAISVVEALDNKLYLK